MRAAVPADARDTLAFGQLVRYPKSHSQKLSVEDNIQSCVIVPRAFGTLQLEGCR